MKLPKKFKANPNALPELLDKEAEIRRLDSIRKSADAELKEKVRLKEVEARDKEIIKGGEN